MGFRLKGGRPKNMKQGVYWVQRHRDDLRRRGARGDAGPPSDGKFRPDALGWAIIIVVSLIIAVAISS